MLLLLGLSFERGYITQHFICVLPFDFSPRSAIEWCILRSRDHWMRILFTLLTSHTNQGSIKFLFPFRDQTIRSSRALWWLMTLVVFFSNWSTYGSNERAYGKENWLDYLFICTDLFVACPNAASWCLMIFPCFALFTLHTFLMVSSSFFPIEI